MQGSEKRMGTRGQAHGRSATTQEASVEALVAEWAELCRVTAEQLRTTLSEEGCPLCRVSAHVAERLCAAMLEARHLPPSTEQQLHRAQGFCTLHVRLLLDAVRSLALPAEGLHRAVLEVLAAARAALRLYGATRPEARLDPAVFKRTIRYGWTKNVARKLAPTGRCAVCLILKSVDERAGYRLLELLGRHDARSRYGPRSALCLPHFRWVLDHAAEKLVLDCVVQAEQGRLEALVDEPLAEIPSRLLHAVGYSQSLGGG